DLVDPGARQAVERELLRRDLDDVLPRAFRVLGAHARRFSPRLDRCSLRFRHLEQLRSPAPVLTKLTSSYILHRSAVAHYRVGGSNDKAGSPDINGKSAQTGCRNMTGVADRLRAAIAAKGK